MSVLPLIALSGASVPALAASIDVVCVGDIMLAHGMKPILNAEGADYPFQKMKSHLRKADILFGNLENPIAAGGRRYPDKEFYFLTDPPHAAGLKNAGFDVVSLANNHVLDFGPEAMLETLRWLDEKGIRACGAGSDEEKAREPAVISHGRRTVAFLAYARTYPLSFSAGERSPGTAFASEAAVQDDVVRARQNNTWVIVSFHWGREYTVVPTQTQRNLARAAIDAGADVVVGHHPHVAQGMELYKNRIIAYSLGNFVFGTKNPNAAEGILLKLRLSTYRTPRAEIVPLLVHSAQTGFQPRLLESRPRKDFLEKLREFSRELGTTIRIKRNRGFLP